MFYETSDPPPHVPPASDECYTEGNVPYASAPTEDFGETPHCETGEGENIEELEVTIREGMNPNLSPK